jgi:hypothetical protein
VTTDTFTTPTPDMPTLKQILGALEKQVLVGRTYLDMAAGLLKTDPALLHPSPTFFGLTIDGSLELSQMAVARLYDETKRTMTVPKLLRRAEREAGSFQRGTPQEVRKAIEESEKAVHSLEPVLSAIRDRRNSWFAHLDPQTISDPKALEAKAKLTMPDLERVFKETERILLELSRLYDGTFGELKYIGWDDYEVALDWIRQAKCAHIEKYEREYGKSDLPRPKDCSRKDWE